MVMSVLDPRSFDEHQKASYCRNRDAAALVDFTLHDKRCGTACRPGYSIGPLSGQCGPLGRPASACHGEVGSPALSVRYTWRAAERITRCLGKIVFDLR